jgi:hypothetical protein
MNIRRAAVRSSAWLDAACSMLALPTKRPSLVFRKRGQKLVALELGNSEMQSFPDNIWLHTRRSPCDTQYELVAMDAPRPADTRL